LYLFLDTFLKYIAVFTSGMYPQICSEGYITPIFKAENPKLPQNYRGITICNSIGKVTLGSSRFLNYK
jgi:hypothetical protein